MLWFMAGLSCSRCKEAISKRDDAMVVATRWRGPMVFHGHCADMNAITKPATEAASFTGAYLLWVIVSVVGIGFLFPQYIFRNQEEVLLPAGVLALSLVIHIVFLARLFQIRSAAQNLE
jgi:hypothetical protein